MTFSRFFSGHGKTFRTIYSPPYGNDSLMRPTRIRNYRLGPEYFSFAVLFRRFCYFHQSKKIKIKFITAIQLRVYDKYEITNSCDVRETNYIKKPVARINLTTECTMWELSESSKEGSSRENMVSRGRKKRKEESSTGKKGWTVENYAGKITDSQRRVQKGEELGESLKEWRGSGL